MRSAFSFFVVWCAVFGVAQIVNAQGLHDIHADADVPCAACHVGEEVPADTPPNDTCVACHGTMIEPVEEGEVVPLPDPHRSPHLGPDEVPDCASCHSIHGQSESTCLMCHRSFDMEMNVFGSDDEGDDDDDAASD